jgi:hypothetical protein
VIRAIIWKEWRKSRWLFLAFVLAAVVIPAIPGQFFPNEGETARGLLRFIWTMFCLFSGALFYEQRSRDTISFSLARPASRPSVFGIQHLSYLIIFCALVVISLSVHYLHMVMRFPELSPLDILLEPELVIDFALCLLFLSLSLFVATSIIQFGGTAVGIVFVVVLASLLLFNEHVTALASHVPSLGPREAPVACLLLLLFGAVFFETLSLWEMSFNELRDARNKRWMRAVASATVLSVLLLVVTAGVIARTTTNLREMGFKEIIVTHSEMYPLACVMIDGAEEDALIAVRKPAYFMRGRFMKREKDGPPELRKGPRGRAFVLAPGAKHGPRWWKWEKILLAFVYFSDKPLLGQEIRRVMGGGRLDVNTISPRYYSRRETLSPPYLSPDNDRVAYLRTSTPRLGGPTTLSLWITKFGYGHSVISDYAELPAEAGTAWEPIGWTPDGYDFMLRKIGSKKSEIQTVDWVARGPRQFLEDFPNAVITGNDLPKAGDWMSVLTKNDAGNWELRVINYRSDERRMLGEFAEPPPRAWEKYGRGFAYYDGTETVNLLYFSDDIRLVKSFSVSGAVADMKFHPHGDKMAFVTADAGANETDASLKVYDSTTERTHTLVAGDFTSDAEQWDWLSGDALVYASDKKLWQVDMAGTRTLLLSLAEPPPETTAHR